MGKSIDFDEPARKVSKATPDELFAEYYGKLLEAVHSAANPTASTCQVSALSDDRNELIQQLSVLSNEIENYKRAGMQHYFRFGFAIAKLKSLYFKVCDPCKVNNPDMFSVLSCKRCTKKSQGNTFFKDVKNVSTMGNYSNGYLNFLINVASLCCKYPKFQTTPWDVAGLKKYLSNYLPDQLEKDKHIWI